MAETLASLIVKVGADISGYTKGIEDATHQLHGIHSAVEEFGEKIKEVALELIAFETLKELATESILAAAAIEKVTVSLTALTGSAEIANRTIEEMEELAAKESIAFPELLTAAQRMTAVGFTLEEIVPALGAADDAAAALGQSIAGVSQVMEGMALSGMAGSKQLKGLGLSSDDLAKVLGVTKDAAAEAFKELNQSDRLAAVGAALGKFGDVAEKTALTTEGRWTAMKNAWHGVFAEIGETVSPITKWLEDIATAAAHAAKELAEVHKYGPASSPAIVAARLTGAALEGLGGERLGNYQAPALSAPAAPGLPSGYSAASEALKKTVREQMEATAASEAAAYALAHQTTALQDAEKRLGLVSQAQKEGLATAGDLRRATEGVTAAFQAANPEFEKIWTKADQAAWFARQLALSLDHIAQTKGVNFELWVDAFERGDTALPPIIESTEKLAAGLENVATWAKAAEETMGGTQAAMRALGLSADGGTIALKAFDLIAEGLGKGTNIQNVEDAWARVSGQIDHLAQSDLPKAIEEYEKYIGALQRANAPQGEINAAKQRELQLEISIAQQRGHSANAQIIQLTNLQHHMAALNGLANTVGNTYHRLGQVFGAAFSTLSHNVSSAIMGAHSFHQAWQASIRSVGQSILDTLIGAAFGALKDALILVVDKIFGIGIATLAAGKIAKAATSAIDVAEVKGAAAVGAANVMAWTMAIPFIGPALAPAAGAAALAQFLPIAALASFDKGGWVPDDMVANIHKGEYIIPAAAAAGIMNTSSIGGNVTIHVNGSKSPRDTAREIANYLKSLSPQFTQRALA